MVNNESFFESWSLSGVDCGAVNNDYEVNEAVIVREVGDLVGDYLRKAGCEVKLLQSDNLAGENPNYPNVCASANNWPADVLSVSIVMQRRQARLMEQSALYLVTGVRRTDWRRASNLKLSIL